MNNVPTIITFSRFIFAIVVAVLLCFESNIILYTAIILFILGSLSDAVDGKLARRQNNPSKFGAFLDPIADKFLVFLVLLSLIYNRDSVAIFILSTLIISREITIMSLREWMASINSKDIVEVSSLGKLKTFLQMSGICLVAGIVVHSQCSFTILIETYTLLTIVVQIFNHVHCRFECIMCRLRHYTLQNTGVGPCSFSISPTACLMW